MALFFYESQSLNGKAGVVGAGDFGDVMGDEVGQVDFWVVDADFCFEEGVNITHILYQFQSSIIELLPLFALQEDLEEPQ
jgi:hypothetical protein